MLIWLYFVVYYVKTYFVYLFLSLTVLGCISAKVKDICPSFMSQRVFVECSSICSFIWLLSYEFIPIETYEVNLLIFNWHDCGPSC